MNVRTACGRIDVAGEKPNDDFRGEGNKNLRFEFESPLCRVERFRRTY